MPGKMQECIPRITRRGWRANIIVAIGFISILGFLVLMLSLESVILSDGVRVAYRTQYVYDMNVTEEEVPSPLLSPLRFLWSHLIVIGA